MANAKSILKSKTFWVAVIQVVIGILTAIQADLTTGGTITLLGIIQIILRVLTTEAVKLPVMKIL